MSEQSGRGDGGEVVPIKPTDWRATWRAPKERAAGLNSARVEVFARARELLEMPLPPEAELRRFGFAVLVTLAADESVQATVRMGAAKAIVDSLKGDAHDGAGEMTVSDCDEMIALATERKQALLAG